MHMVFDKLMKKKIHSQSSYEGHYEVIASTQVSRLLIIYSQHDAMCHTKKNWPTTCVFNKKRLRAARAYRLLE